MTEQSAEGIALRAATRDDLLEIEQLLTRLKLPLDGIPHDLANFRVALSGERIVGVAGLELGGAGDALLRSVAVDPDHRNRGIAARLVDALEGDADQSGVRTLFLLTTTAADYFARRGFERITREDVPPELTRTAEFQGACPASATVMRGALPLPK